MKPADTAVRGVPVGSFGDKFRQERERRGFTLDDVSNVTKIGSRMLKAIEDERFDRLPGGVFNKGFIRAYARHLGFNDEEAVAEYLAALRQAQVDAQNAWISPPTPRPESSPPQLKPASASRPLKPALTGEELPGLQLPKAEHVRPRPPVPGGALGSIPWQVPTLVVALVIAGMIFWNRHSHSAHAEGAASPRATASQASVSDSSAHSAAAGVMSSPATAPPSGQTANTAPSSALPVPASQSDAADENDVTTHNLTPHHSTAAAPAPPPALTLVIRAAENSWVSVIADGQQVTQETLIAPAQTRVHASRDIVVRVGNSAAVSFLLNGKEIPVEGSEAEGKTFVFDQTGMRLAPPAPDPAH